MHDPKTVAHEIRSPFKDKHGYRKPIVTIWHNDPETDGSDDSCGWTYPKTTKEEREKYKGEVDFMKKMVLENYRNWSDRNRMSLIYTTFGTIKWMRYKKRINSKDLVLITSLAYNYHDDIKIYLSDNDFENEREVESFFFCILRQVKYSRRKWYQHPKWHIHHWSIQFHPWQQLKRYYWDKCCVCGKRGFKGESAYGDWSGTKVWHQHCDTSSPKPDRL